MSSIGMFSAEVCACRPAGAIHGRIAHGWADTALVCCHQHRKEERAAILVQAANRCVYLEVAESARHPTPAARAVSSLRLTAPKARGTADDCLRAMNTPPCVFGCDRPLGQRVSKPRVTPTIVALVSSCVHNTVHGRLKREERIDLHAMGAAIPRALEVWLNIGVKCACVTVGPKCACVTVGGDTMPITRDMCKCRWRCKSRRSRKEDCNFQSTPAPSTSSTTFALLILRSLAQPPSPRRAAAISRGPAPPEMIDPSFSLALFIITPPPPPSIYLMALTP